MIAPHVRLGGPLLLLLMIALLGTTACRSEPAAASDRPLGWALGEQYRYKLHMASRAGTALDTAPPMFDFELSGELEITPLETLRDRTVLVFSVKEPLFARAPSEEARARFEQVARDLARPSLFTFVAGTVTESRLPKDASALTVGILRNLAAALQFKPPPDARRTWTAEEYDATGRYVAEYNRDGESGLFTKRKVNYAALILDKKVEAQIFPVKASQPKFAQSTGEVRLQNGVPTRIRLEEHVEAALTVSSPLQTQTTIALDLTADAPAPTPDTAGLLASTTLVKADAPYVHASGELDLDSAKIGGLSFDQIVSGLEAVAKERGEVELTETLNDEPAAPDKVEAGKSWLARHNRLFTALAATFRQRPDTIHRAMAIIRSGSPASRTMISALGAAGTQAGHEALLSLMNDRKLTDKTRKSAGLSLVRTKVPTVFAAHALERLLGDPYWKEYATFGLGTYARRLGEAGNRAELERIGGILLGILSGTKSRSARLDALAGISNSGYSGALEAVRPLLTDGDDVIRSAAVQAIRLMKHPDVDGLIIERLKLEERPDVRVTALQALRNREPTAALGAALSERGLRDENARVRMEAVKLIIRWQKELPELGSVLQQIAQNEADGAIRRAAASETARP